MSIHTFHRDNPSTTHGRGSCRIPRQNVTCIGRCNIVGTHRCNIVGTHRGRRRRNVDRGREGVRGPVWRHLCGMRIEMCMDMCIHRDTCQGDIQRQSHARRHRCARDRRDGLCAGAEKKEPLIGAVRKKFMLVPACAHLRACARVRSHRCERGCIGMHRYAHTHAVPGVAVPQPGPLHALQRDECGSRARVSEHQLDEEPALVGGRKRRERSHAGVGVVGRGVPFARQRHTGSRRSLHLRVLG